jgi:hypothetical protein
MLTYGIAKCPRIWQAWLMAKSKMTAREKSRQDANGPNPSKTVPGS